LPLACAHDAFVKVRYRKPGDDSHEQAMADEATMRLA
jgi:hypothetical protein